MYFFIFYYMIFFNKNFFFLILELKMSISGISQVDGKRNYRSICFLLKAHS